MSTFRFLLPSDLHYVYDPEEEPMEIVMKLVLISPELTRIMGLSNSVYTSSLLMMWWTNYTRKNNLSINGIIHPDTKMVQAFYEARPYPFINIVRLLRGHITRNVNIEITNQLKEDLETQYCRLLKERNKWRILDKEEFKARRLQKRTTLPIGPVVPLSKILSQSTPSLLSTS